MRAFKLFLSAEEYVLMLRWADRRGRRLTEVEIEWCEAKAALLRELLARWEPIGVTAAPRCAAVQVDRSRAETGLSEPPRRSGPGRFGVKVNRVQAS